MLFNVCAETAGVGIGVAVASEIWTIFLPAVLARRLSMTDATYASVSSFVDFSFSIDFNFSLTFLSTAEAIALAVSNLPFFVPPSADLVDFFSLHSRSSLYCAFVRRLYSSFLW